MNQPGNPDRPIEVINLLNGLPAASQDELFTTLFARPGLRIERIVSIGHASPPGFWYDQSHPEWVIVLQGAAELRFDDETIRMKTGDAILIPARRKHRVEATTSDPPTVWLAVHSDET